MSLRKEGAFLKTLKLVVNEVVVAFVRRKHPHRLGAFTEFHSELPFAGRARVRDQSGLNLPIYLSHRPCLRFLR